MGDQKDQENRAPSKHEPSAVAEGAQQKTQSPASKTGLSEEQPRAEFSWERWRLQVVCDRSLIASQKLILLILGHVFEEQGGSAEVTHEWLSQQTSLSMRAVATHTALLEKLQWFKRERKSHSIIYEAVRGRS